MADAAFFAQNERVVTAIKKIKQNCANKFFPDIVDGAGHQYVDLVMEGGGVLGVALTGYTYALEQAGIRFLGIGGTSAGSINALLIAALGKPEEAKSEKLVDVLANIPMASFIDGDPDARDFSQAVIEKAGMVKLLWKAAQVMDNLNDDLGLNPGRAFLKWLSGELKKVGIRTNTDLRRNLETMPASLRLRDGTELKDEDKCGRLAMVVADVTTETKVEFPKMAELYWANPEPKQTQNCDGYFFELTVLDGHFTGTRTRLTRSYEKANKPVHANVILALVINLIPYWGEKGHGRPYDAAI